MSLHARVRADWGSMSGASDWIVIPVPWCFAAFVGAEMLAMVLTALDPGWGGGRREGAGIALFWAMSGVGGISSCLIRGIPLDLGVSIGFAVVMSMVIGTWFRPGLILFASTSRNGKPVRHLQVRMVTGYLAVIVPIVLYLPVFLSSVPD